MGLGKWMEQVNFIPLRSACGVESNRSSSSLPVRSLYGRPPSLAACQIAESMTTQPNHLKQTYRIPCGTVWGGIQPVSLDAYTKGVNATLYSNASGSKRGGDIYYMSVCSNDSVTRMLVADVRGHGEQVSDISAWIYQSLLERMNSIDSAGVLSELNLIVHTRGSTAITTAVVVSHDINEAALYYAYAGHPPVLARESGRQWLPLVLETKPGQANLPLGAFRSVRYDQGEIGVHAGERLLLYTDGLSEAMGPQSEEEFGEKELPALLETQGDRELTSLRDALVKGATAFSGGPLSDDCTFMIVEIR
jgi:phosphoserine phosphatase RsbU/P